MIKIGFLILALILAMLLCFMYVITYIILKQPKNSKTNLIKINLLSKIISIEIEITNNN